MAYKSSSTTVIDNDFTYTSLTLAGNVSVYTSPGTFTVPTGITIVHAFVFGGGGGGGGGNRQALPPADTPVIINRAGGTGGTGGALYKESIPTSPGSSFNITVGLGGTGSNNGTGGTGGASSVFTPGATYTANGGTGGLLANIPSPGLPGTPGTGSGGDVNSNYPSLFTEPAWNSGNLGNFIPTSTLLFAIDSGIYLGGNPGTTSWAGLYQGTLSTGGAGESGLNFNNSQPGVGGGVILFY